MYRYLINSKLPKFLKVLLIILLTITCIYWIIIGTYRLLELIRVALHWVTDKGHWWEFVMCVMVLLIGSILIAQFYLELDPFGNFGRWIQDKLLEIKGGILG